MRTFARAILALFILAGTLLLSIPGEVAKEMFLQSVADYVARVTGFKVPVMETIISGVWRAMPFLAVCAIAYLYHLVYSRMNPQGVGVPVWENVASRPASIKERAAAAFSVVCLVAFVGAVGVAEWRYYPPASDSMKYAELSHVSNHDLRERAFAVGRRLLALNEVYQAKQKEINDNFESAASEWRKEYDKFTKEMDEYKKKIEEYNAALPPLSPPQYPFSDQNLFSQGYTYSPALGPTNTAPAQQSAALRRLKWNR